MPLHGCTVAELTEGIAGAYAGRLLADLGARILKVEPPSGDELRRSREAAAAFAGLNHGKLSLCLSLGHPQAGPLLQRLAARVDAIIASSALPCQAAGQVMTAANPGIVQVVIEMPRQAGGGDDAGTELIAQAVSGIMSITGSRDGPPCRVGFPLAHMLSGLQAATALLTGLLARRVERSRQRRGQTARVGMVESLLALQATNLANYLGSGVASTRHGGAIPTSVPAQAFRAGDGRSFTLSILFDAHWQRLCAVLGFPEAGADERFATRRARLENRAAVLALLEPRFLERSRQEWLDLLLREDFLAAPVNDFPDLFADPQVRHNALVSKVRDSSGAAVRVIRNPIHYSAIAGAQAGKAPALGRHTRAILEELRYSREECARWLMSGVAAEPGMAHSPKVAATDQREATGAFAGPLAAPLLAASPQAKDDT